MWKRPYRSGSILHWILFVESPAQKSQSYHIEEVVKGHYQLDYPDYYIKDGEDESKEQPDAWRFGVVFTGPCDKVNKKLFEYATKIFRAVGEAVYWRFKYLVSKLFSSCLEVVVLGEDSYELEKPVDDRKSKLEDEDDEGDETIKEICCKWLDFLCVDQLIERVIEDAGDSDAQAANELQRCQYFDRASIEKDLLLHLVDIVLRQGLVEPAALHEYVVEHEGVDCYDRVLHTCWDHGEKVH